MTWCNALEVDANAKSEDTGRYGAVWCKIRELERNSTREVGGPLENMEGPMAERCRNLNDTTRMELGMREDTTR